jgi:hypothetical protein
MFKFSLRKVIPENKTIINDNHYYDLTRNIRNGLKLTKSEIDYITKLSRENLLEIITIYDILIDLYISEF